MYDAGTILTLKEPRSTKDEVFAYDRVQVIGASPINHANVSSEWAGNNGQGVLVTPLSGFGANIDEPFGRLRELYDVESIPERKLAAPVGAIQAAEYDPKSPEEIFEDAQGGPERVKEPKRKPSPLLTAEELGETETVKTVYPEKDSPLNV